MTSLEQQRATFAMTLIQEFLDGHPPDSREVAEYNQQIKSLPGAIAINGLLLILLHRRDDHPVRHVRQWLSGRLGAVVPPDQLATWLANPERTNHQYRLAQEEALLIATWLKRWWVPLYDAIPPAATPEAPVETPDHA